MPARPFALITAAFLSVGAAQAPIPRPPAGQVPAPASKTQAQVVGVTLTGCLDGSRFEPTPGSLNDAQFRLLGASEFVLQGPRDLLRQLTRDHKGHEESITGVAIIPPQPSDATIDIKSATRGKTTAAGGVRDAGGDGSTPASPDLKLPVRIRVQSATHISDHCVPRP